MTKEQDSEKAFKLNEEIKKRETLRRQLFILNVLDLVKMYDEKLYPAILGEGAEAKWAGYLGQLEVFYTRSQVERWRKIITKLVGDFKMDPDKLVEAPETRLANIAEVAKTKEEAEVMFKQALVVPARDWKLIMCEKQGKESLEDCGHSEFKTYKICARCGFKKQE